MTQYRMTLNLPASARLRPEWAYRLYGALLESAPEEFGKQVHRQGVTPVSQFLEVPPQGQPCWVVSLLSPESEEALSPVLESRERFSLRREPREILIVGREKRQLPSPEGLLLEGAVLENRFRLEFCTATAFKSAGESQILPTVRLILQSLILKWNGCFPQCQIEDEGGEGLEALSAGLVCREFSLRSAEYPLKGVKLPGFVGEMVLENHLKGFHRELANALLLFSGWSGIGMKTTLGMGGVRCRPL